MGLLVVNIIILIVGAVLLAIGGGFGANAASRIGQIPNYQDDSNLNTAHNYAKTGAIITWVTLGVLILVAILTLIFAGKIATGSGAKWFISILLFLVAAAALVSGILFLLSASKITATNLADDNGSASHARTAGFILIGGAVVILVAAIIVIVIRAKNPTQQKIEVKQQELAVANIKARRKALAAKQEAAVEELRLRQAEADRKQAVKNKALAQVRRRKAVETEELEKEKAKLDAEAEAELSPAVEAL